MPEYVVVAHDPDQAAVGDHITENRDDAIDYASHFLDDEERTGAFVTITVINSAGDEDLSIDRHDNAERRRWPLS